MKDISPELLRDIQDTYSKLLDENTVIAGIKKKIESKTINYDDAFDYACQAGEAYAEALKKVLNSEVLPDGKMYWNIAQSVVKPTLEDMYDKVADVAQITQKQLNEAANIGIKALRVTNKEDRIEGLLNRLACEETYDDISWILDRPVVTMAQSVIDDSVKINSEFQYKAGLKPKIIRTAAGGCCKWCTARAGVFVYPDVPKDIYRRHENCNCTVVYNPGEGKKYQNVWSKEWKNADEKDIIENRKKVGLKESHNLVLRKGTDVTTEYERQKFPGQGKITYGEGYNELIHEDEINFAQLLHNKLGGDITLLNEANIQGVKTPDYIWNGKYWDLKTTSTAKSANSALRHGLKQIKNNPGGVILNYESNNVNLQEVIDEVENRIRQSKKDTYKVDVMIVFNQEIVKIIRY